MTDDEKRTQVEQQCRAVAHMAGALAEVSAALEKVPRTGIGIDLIGDRTARHMEILGDILNGMDAVDEAEDGWITPVIRAAHTLWPQPNEHTGARNAALEEAAKACEGYDGGPDGDPDDDAASYALGNVHNAAVRMCAAAIRGMKTP